MQVRSVQPWVAFLACHAGALLCAFAAAAQPAPEMHGMADAYAAPGVALAWGILRGRDETTTLAVARIAADPRRYPLVAAVGSNPFSQQQRALLVATPTSGGVELRIPRAQFGDLPRTELRFYASPAAARADTPALVVYYLGLPDTTPEFATQASLEAYLADRLARVRAAAGDRAP